MSNGTPALASDPGLPPPINFDLSTPFLDVLKTFYTFSQDLVDNPPKLIVLYADTLQVNWKVSGLGTGAEASTIRIKLEASPGLPASIVPALHP